MLIGVKFLNKPGSKIRRKRERPQLLKERKKRKREQEKKQKIMQKAMQGFVQVIEETMKDLKELEKK